MFISGTISHLTGLSGSVGSTAPQGGKFVFPPLTNVILQLFGEFVALINGRNKAASPVRLERLPSQRVGYGLVAETSLKSKGGSALFSAISWNNVAQFPKVPSPLFMVLLK